MTPDKELLGPEYALVFIILNFKKMLLIWWDIDIKDNKNYINKKFDEFHSCLQAVVTTKLDLWAAKYNGDIHTGINFMNCVKGYLEAVIKCTNMGDQVIHWLCLKSTPSHMNFEELLNWCTQILSYVKKSYLCYQLEIPNKAELCKQMFIARPKPHHDKYAKKHFRWD